MASTIVNTLQAKGASYDVILATVLCWLALATALLGVALWITGRLRLATLVQYLPMPVVGGYLAFIGFYCLEAAFTLMSGKPIQGVLDWKLLGNKNSILLMVPGILGGAAIYLTTRRFPHPSVLPLCLLVIPAGFFIVLAATGTSLDAASESLGYGWVDKSSNSTQFWLVWEHYAFSIVDWSVIPHLIPSWVAMYFVVAFSSSLDVAAIQMELGRTLHYNEELKTVGISNLVSGLTGGFTGSYIFSQTIFTMRAHVGCKPREKLTMMSPILTVAPATAEVPTTAASPESLVASNCSTRI